MRIHRAGVKDFHHPVVGDLSLSFEMMDFVADTGLAIPAYTAESGSRSAEGLNLLGSWAATLEQGETAPSTSEARRA